MAREIRKQTIDGLTFTVQMLPGRAASRLFVRLSKYLIPGIARMGKSLEHIDLRKGLSQEIDLAGVATSLADAVEFIMEHLDEKEWDALVDQLLETALVSDGKTEQLLMSPGVYDTILAGKVTTQLKLMKFALEVNYNDFWTGPGAKLQALAAGAMSKLRESTTSKTTGPVGVS